MPDNATPIEAISLNFYTESENALKGIDTIVSRLNQLQKVVQNSFSFNIKITGVAGLKSLSGALNDIPTENVGKLERLSAALEKLSGVNIDPTVSRSAVSLSKALSRIESAKADKMAETYEKLGELSGSGVLGGTIKDTGIDEDVGRRYEALSMFVDMSANSFARFNDQLMQTSMYSAITARSLDALYQSMGIGMGTQAVPMLPAPQTAGLLPALSTTTFDKLTDSFSSSTTQSKLLADGLRQVREELLGIKQLQFGGLLEPGQNPIAGLLPERSSAGSYNWSPAPKSWDMSTAQISYMDTGNAIPSVTQDFQGLDVAAIVVTNDVRKLGKEVSNVGKQSKAIQIASGVIGAFGNAASRATGKFHQMFRSIKRIATYRLIRSALRAITNGFKEGIQNLYQWDKSFSKTKQFSSSLDSLATSAHYLKNALGTLAAPLINALAPAIDWVVDKFVGMINLFNKWIAQFNGQATYTIAKKVPKVFGDTANDANKAAKGIGKATKALKSFTIGIDELNIIEDTPSSGSGGGGAISSAIKDVEEMFEEVPTGDMGFFGEAAQRGFAAAIAKGIGEAGANFIEDSFLGDILNPIREAIWGDLQENNGNGVFKDIALQTAFPLILAMTGDFVSPEAVKTGNLIAAGIAVGIEKDENIPEAVDKKLGLMGVGNQVAIEAAGRVLGGSLAAGAAAGFNGTKFKIPINKESGVTSAKSFLQGYQPTFVKGMDKLLGSPVNTKKYKHTGTTISREMALGILEGKGDINMAISEALQPKRRGGSGDYRELGKSVADSISAGIASGKSNLSSKLKKLVTDSTSGGKSAAKSKDVKDIGKYIVEGIIAGASDKKKDLEKAMKNLAKLAEAGFAAGAMIKSPSKLMAKDGAFLVQGLNMGIENEAHTTADVMDNWLSSISDSVSIDVSNISMPNVADIVDEVQGYIATTGSMSIKSDTETMQRFYTDNIIPILSDIANDAKRQADKEEKTEVVLDNRKVTSAVNRQNRVNGYSFT